MNIGYARVSTDEQNLDLQQHALEAEGCNVIYSDKASGAALRRPGLARALRRCKTGDVLVVWKLDRLGRSLINLIELVERLNARGVGLRVLTGQGAMIDTTRPEGRLIFAIFATLAEFERELIRERTRAGMEAARRRGVHVGRPAKMTPEKIRQAQRWLMNGQKTANDIADDYGVHLSTLYAALRRKS